MHNSQLCRCLFLKLLCSVSIHTNKTEDDKVVYKYKSHSVSIKFFLSFSQTGQIKIVSKSSFFLYIFHTYLLKVTILSIMFNFMVSEKK